MILHRLKILIDRVRNIFEWFLRAGQRELATYMSPTKTILLYCQATRKCILVHNPCTMRIPRIRVHRTPKSRVERTIPDRKVVRWALPRMKLFQSRLCLQMEHRHLRISLLHLSDKKFHRDWSVAIPKDNLSLSMILYYKHERQHVVDIVFILVCKISPMSLWASQLAVQRKSQ